MKKRLNGRKEKASKKAELDDLFIELRKEYLAEFSEKIDAIKKFWEVQNREGLQNEFHKIKGTGTTYGLPELSDVAAVLERLCEINSDKLGLSLLLAIDLFKTICHTYEKDQDFD